MTIFILIWLKNNDDAKDKLKQILWGSTKTLSLQSSIDKYNILYENNQNDIYSSKGINSDWSDTNQFSSKDFESKMGHIKGDTIIFHNVDDNTGNDLE